MVTKTDKKNAIRQGIVNAAIVYSQNLGGKTFLYVYGDEYFEVSFPIDHFLHLTGVETRLSAKDFYKNVKKSILTNNQLYFDARHVYANAKKKLPCLKRLPELTNEIIGNDPEHKVQRLLDYTNRPRDIADPWYTGNFDETFDDVMEGCQAFLSYLMEHLQ